MMADTSQVTPMARTIYGSVAIHLDAIHREMKMLRRGVQNLDAIHSEMKMLRKDVQNLEGVLRAVHLALSKWT
jgi:hypothetical protein